MRAIVTGASGFLGYELVGQLLDAGIEAVGAVGPVQTDLEARRIEALRGRGVRLVDCELRREQPLDAAPPEWEVLYHLAAYVKTEEDSPDVRINDLGTARLLRQLPPAGKRIVYTSTLAVADNAPGGKITLETVCRPRTEYGRSKLAAEAIVRSECAANAGTHTILRLPTLYGAGYRPGGMFDVLPKRIGAGDPFARLAWPGRMALLSVVDCASLVRRAAGAESTRDRTFIGSSNENPTTWEISARIAEVTGARHRSIGIPAIVARTMSALLGPGWQAPLLPHAVQIAAWRAHLLLDGLHCEGIELARALDARFEDWRQGFAAMYAGYPDRRI